MPVWKYKSVEDMPEAWTMNRDVSLARRIHALMSLAPISGSLNLPRGVRKYRSIEEMKADRDRYEQARIERLRAERQPK